jgi:hypothetical protein
MSNLWVEIETLVLDGVPMNPAQGRRLAQFTEIALARLLEQRGTATRISPGNDEQEREVRKAETTMRMPANANEARWAEELALTLYRAMDGTF